MSLEAIVRGDVGVDDCWCFLRRGPGSSVTTAGPVLLVALMKRDSRLWFGNKRQMRGNVCVYAPKEGKISVKEFVYALRKLSKGAELMRGFVYARKNSVFSELDVMETFAIEDTTKQNQ